MTKPVRLRREAALEVRDAAKQYGDEHPALRAAFLAAIDEAIARLTRMAPHLGPAPGSSPELGVKRVLVKRFPYSLYFVETPTRYRVLAVAHARRAPLYWIGRR